ncbi:hypothetical protein AB0Q95_12805 [Streptomyces sp. NPDC059900]|uniref:hypothetical protein n=1 Tax=Streptomyces sp. NPDC059900 TaxID=3155816 RepID=UPI00342FAA0F
MAFTEIAVAVITTGPAYIAVWLTARRPRPEAAQPQTCAHAAACGQCEDKSAVDAAPGYRAFWALAA